MNPFPRLFPGLLLGAVLALAPAATAQAPDGVDQMVAAWPETSRMAAQDMMERYGEPDGVTDRMLVWYDTGPFKQTIVYRDPVQHNFPMPHEDVLEQFVDYLVPPERFSEIAMYDGSVIVERTKGEMSARCDKEPMNILALNLAHDIAQGQRSVEDARRTYAEQAMAFMEGEPAPLTERLMFAPQSGATDPDVPAEGM